MGEGNNELGGFDRDGARSRGLLEALLAKVCATAGSAQENSRGARCRAARTRSGLEEQDVAVKLTHEYVDVVDRAELGAAPDFGLPFGAESLRSWLVLAHEILDQLVHGTLPP